MSDFVACRHEITGAVADLPVTGVKHFRGWIPIDQAEPAPAEPEPAAQPPIAIRTAKSKAADTATTEKE